MKNGIALFTLLGLFGCVVAPECPETAPEDAGAVGDGGICHPRHTVDELDRLPCADDRKRDICNGYGLLIAAVCYPSGLGPNPLSDIAPSFFPSYGCKAPLDFNMGDGAGRWAWWCCSKVFPGPLVCD